MEKLKQFLIHKKDSIATHMVLVSIRVIRSKALQLKKEMKNQNHNVMEFSPSQPIYISHTHIDQIASSLQFFQTSKRAQ